MLYKVIIKPSAESDLSQAIEWYENQKQGLGMDFLLNFEAVVVLMRSNPLLFLKVFLNFRLALMQKYPYAIYYSVNKQDKVVDVIAVLSTARNPKIIRKRLKL